MGNGCSYNTDCSADYDEDDECYVKEWFGEDDEGFCWDGPDGDCRAKKTIGEACKNAGGNYDNNNCVTRHCDDVYGVCRAYNRIEDCMCFFFLPLCGVHALCTLNEGE